MCWKIRGNISANLQRHRHTNYITSLYFQLSMYFMIMYLYHSLIPTRKVLLDLSTHNPFTLNDINVSPPPPTHKYTPASPPPKKKPYKRCPKTPFKTYLLIYRRIENMYSDSRIPSSGISVQCTAFLPTVTPNCARSELG